MESVNILKCVNLHHRF